LFFLKQPLGQIKWKDDIAKLNEKDCPFLWQLVLGRGLQSTKQLKQMLKISAKQLMLLLKHQPRAYLQDLISPPAHGSNRLV